MKNLFFFARMRARQSNLTEKEWLELGDLAKFIRDCIMDFCAGSIETFGKNSKVFRRFKLLDGCFSHVRCHLDSFIFKDLGLETEHIGNGIRLTQVFYGPSEYDSQFNHDGYKRGKKPHAFNQAQLDRFEALYQNVDLLFSFIDQHRFLAVCFKEKEAKATLTRFKKRVQDAENIIEEIQN